MKRSGFKRKITKPLKRSKLQMRGVSETSVLKDKIQELVRKIVMERDGGCILRFGLKYTSDLFPRITIPVCNGYRKDGEMIYQADHLLSRSNSATYADTRLIVCLCKGHHGWKSVGSNMRKAQYDEVVKFILPKERVKLWERCEKDRMQGHRHMGSYDWKMAIVALEQELAGYYERGGWGSSLDKTI